MIYVAAVLLLTGCGSVSGYPTICKEPKPNTAPPKLVAAQIKADTPNEKAGELLMRSLATAAEYAKGLERFAESCKANPEFRPPEKKVSPKQAARKD